MFGEINLDHFDDLIEGYGVASAYADRLDDLEREIVQIAARLGSQQPQIHDFSQILESRMSPSDERIRHAAWLMQHVYRCRAWSVNQSILLRRRCGENGFESALLDQLKKLEVPTCPVDISEWRRAQRRVNPGARKKLDVMMVDRRSHTIYLIVGQSYRQTRRLSPTLTLAKPYNTLFGLEHRVFLNANTERSTIATLRMAGSLLRAAVPTYTVKCLVALTDDPGCSWQFQCHEVPHKVAGYIKKKRVRLDDFVVDRTHHDIAARGKAEEDPLASLPKGASSQSYLRAAPVDRPIRSLMVLNSLLDEQEAATQRLVMKPAREIALKVAFDYGISYPRDMYRHDLLELERARLVKRARNKDNAYGLTPKGIGRIFVMARRFDPSVQADPDVLLARVRRQGSLWAGTNVL